MACKKLPRDWKYAIEVLKEFPHKLARMDQEVYSLLKFSYDSLPNDTMRSCLLYCSLYQEDYSIGKDYLIDRWFCEGFLDEFCNVRKARMQGHYIINCLLNACLLEPCEGVLDSVKMHDVIRDMTLWIASESETPEKKFLVRTGAAVGSVMAVLEVENWEGLRMSLANNGIEELRGTPVCSNLQTLFVKSEKLKVISDGFFQLMRNLRVLNLSFNLKLRELPKGIAELVSLECLDLLCTGVVGLPTELNRLSKLKCLNLAVTPYLRKIPHQLICNMSRLQIFRINISDENLDELDEANVLRGGNEHLIEELECLQHLDSVVIEIKTAFALESFLNSHKLVKCTEQLSLAAFWKSKELNILPLVNMERLEGLTVRDCESIQEIKVKIEKEPGDDKMIKSSCFANTPCFHTLNLVSICGCDGLRDLTWLIFAPNLRWLVVVLCAKLEEILSESKLNESVGLVGSPFAKLETLYLGDLPELKSICWDAQHFPCLKQIKVFNSSKLKKLPLKLDSAKGNQISIEGHQDWWDEVEWKDEATRNAFLPSFKHAYWWKDIDWEGEDCKGQRSDTFRKQVFLYYDLFRSQCL